MGRREGRKPSPDVGSAGPELYSQKEPGLTGAGVEHVVSPRPPH